MAYNAYTISGPVADGTLTNDPIMADYFHSGVIAVIFYSDALFQFPVQPTAGTITFLASETGVSFGTILNGTVDASLAQYDRPNFGGSAQVVSATTLGIDVASFYRAIIYRFGDV